METTFEISGTPYFILETESGVFYAVSSFRLTEETTTANLNRGVGKLELGLDLIEVPTRGISLIVRTPEKVNVVPYVIEELKKLASISSMDYFSYETFGRHCCQPVVFKSDTEIHEIKPRLFRKIVND